MTGAIGARLVGLSLDGGKAGKDIPGVLVAKTSQGPEEDAITIERCKIGRFSGDGLNLKFIWCVTLLGNMICYNEGCGIRFSGYDALVSDNWISGNATVSRLACYKVA